MTQTVLVPGLFGCSMTDATGRIVWPPGNTPQPIDSTSLVNALTDPATMFGAVIGRVPFPCNIEAYAPLIEALDERGNFTAFAYDWRTDVRDAAAALAARLATLPAGEDIHLVAHSMGGLVARWLLESGEYDGKPWFSRVVRAVFVAVPHLGAPLALFRILGKDATVAILVPGWASALLAGNPAQWPAGYQLLPPSGIDCVTLVNGIRQDVEEVFATQLLPAGLAKMSAVHAVLERFARPEHTSYLLAYGRGSAGTVAGVQMQAGGFRMLPGDGDGTVPVWSAEPSGSVPAAAPAFDDVAPFVADHVGMLGNRLFLQRLTGWLNGTALLTS